MPPLNKYYNKKTLRKESNLYSHLVALATGFGTVLINQWLPQLHWAIPSATLDEFCI